MAPSRRRGSSKASATAAAAAKRNWKVGDLVLAKVKGFPAWPATVSEPEKWGYSTDWKKVLVYFFGTKQIAFCNPADVEAFTEEKKKSLLSKRHGKGADFVRAVQEIVGCYEKSKEQERDDEVNSGDEGNISNAGNMVDSMGKMGLQSPTAIPNSRLESLCVSTDNNDLHHLIDVKTEMANGDFRDMDTVSEEQFENLSSLDHLRKTTLVASDSLRKRLIDAPIQSFVIQKRTAVRRSRSTIKVEPGKLQSQVMPVNDISTNIGAVLPNATRNESAKRSRRNRKSPGTSVWHHIESPGYSAAFASNVSSEDNGSDTGATNSDTISVNGENTLEFRCTSEHPGTVVEVLDRGIQLSDRFNLPVESFVFKKKRKPTRKRLSHSTAALTVSPDKSPGSGIRVEKTISAPSNACENLRANGDEHLPLVKRARVRMGKPLSEEKQHNELLDAELEPSKKASTNNSEPTLVPFSCVNDFRDVNGSSLTNGYTHTEKEPIWNSKYQLRGSVDGEAALPPSKRLHRALEAMSANAAEEGQTFIDAQETTKVTSSNGCSDSSGKSSSHISVDNEVGSAFIDDQETTKVTSSNGCSDSSGKSSSHISVDNEVGSASEVQNASSFADNDVNMNGEYELMHGLTSSTSEISEKASSELKSCEHLVECSKASKSDDYKEMEIVSKNSVEIKHSDDSPFNTHSSETKAIIKSPHPSSSFKQEQGVIGSKVEPMDLSLPMLNTEKLVILGSSQERSNGNLMLEHAYFQEDKLTQEQGTSQPNHRGQDSSEVNEAGLCSSGGDDTHLSVVIMDSCKNMQSLVSPLDKNVPAMCEVVKDVKYKPAEKDRDPNSMKALIAAAQAKRQLSLSTSLSDNVLDDKVVYDTLSSPSSVHREGSCEQLSPPSSTVCHLSTVDNRNHTVDNRNHLLHNGSLEVLPSKNKSSRLLELEEVGNLTSSFSHRQKSLGKWTKAEANAVRKSFESMLGTLSRTKESIGRATRLAIDCAKSGIADEVLEILVRNLETESTLHKRVDLFFLVDSITQCSRGQKGDIGDVYPSAVQTLLPRLLSAAAPPGNTARENRRQCLKVLRLWLERKTLPESIVRHHMRELESADASFATVHSRRPSRMERALDDPIREMEGMHVDEYGSNASFQLPGFCMPRMLQEEGSDAEEGSFEAVTPEQDPEIPVEREATPTSVYEKHCHILEDVDGELEMEDVAPSFETEKSCANDVTAVDNIGASHHQFEQHRPLLFAPPLPGYFPPSPPPLPASPPPIVPPPPPLPRESVMCHPFAGSLDLKFQSNPINMQNPSQQHMSQQPDTTNLNSATLDTVHYCAPVYKDLGKQSLRPGSLSSSSSRCIAPPPHPCDRQHMDGGSLHNKSYHLQPPPPMLSNQFSYAHEDQRRRSWMEASSSSCTKRFRYGLDMHREDMYENRRREEMYENRRRMELTRHEVGERCRLATPVHSVPVQSDNPEAAYAPTSHYGPPQESPRILNRGWSFPPRTLGYHDPTPFRPPEAPNLWRRR